MSVKPAMTAEEWTDGYVTGNGGALDLGATDLGDGTIRTHGDFWTGTKRQALAALCLHGQPFGFTREDVEMLRLHSTVEWQGVDHPIPQLVDLADRIEALLPPEEL